MALLRGVTVLGAHRCAHDRYPMAGATSPRPVSVQRVTFSSPSLSREAVHPDSWRSTHPTSGRSEQRTQCSSMVSKRKLRQKSPPPKTRRRATWRAGYWHSAKGAAKMSRNGVTVPCRCRMLTVSRCASRACTTGDPLQKGRVFDEMHAPEARNAPSAADKGTGRCCLRWFYLLIRGKRYLALITFCRENPETMKQKRVTANHVLGCNNWSDRNLWKVLRVRESK